MKLAFSTLGCPDFDWPDIYSMAKDFGFSGIELRGMGNDIFSIKAKPFSEEGLPQTIEQLHKKHLEIPCVSTGCALKDREHAQENQQEIREYIDLAAKLGAPYLRILGDRNPAPEGEVDDLFILEQLKSLAPYAEQRDVTLLVETNGVYADTSRLHNLLNSVGSDNVAALWDIHHPYRFAGEAPEQTVQNLGNYIKYTHIKDSVSVDGEVQYRLMGEGDLPVDDVMRALRSINYEGYVSLEWVKWYAPDLSDAGIVFPHFANFMSPYLGEKREESRLYDNNQGTGKYVWPKEHLIDQTFPQVLDRMVEEFPINMPSVTPRSTIPAPIPNSGTM